MPAKQEDFHAVSTAVPSQRSHTEQLTHLKCTVRWGVAYIQLHGQYPSQFWNVCITSKGNPAPTTYHHPQSPSPKPLSISLLSPSMSLPGTVCGNGVCGNGVCAWLLSLSSVFSGLPLCRGVQRHLVFDRCTYFRPSPLWGPLTGAGEAAAQSLPPPAGSGL